MKLTKEQSKAHQKAMDLVKSDRTLTLDERSFVLQNYQEAQGQLNSLAGAFFTPFELARDFSIEVHGGRVVDLCAGIGMLSFACWLNGPGTEFVCVERCPAYVEVGRRILPEAHWIGGDVFETDYGALGGFDVAISNPPFGAIAEQSFKGKYTGGQFEFKVIEQASRFAGYGVFLLPQMSAPFRYSGARRYEVRAERKCAEFMKQTGLELTVGTGIDTSIYKDEWHGVSPICEVVCCEFPQAPGPAQKDLSTEQQTLDLFSTEGA